MSSGDGSSRCSGGEPGQAVAVLRWPEERHPFADPSGQTVAEAER